MATCMSAVIIPRIAWRSTMEAANRHVHQIPTKRSSLMNSYLRRRYGEDGTPAHIWCGVSVEDYGGDVEDQASPGQPGGRRLQGAVHDALPARPVGRGADSAP